MTDLVKSFTYGEDISEKTAVKFSQEGVVVKATSDTDNVCGIAIFSGEEGAKGDVLLFGFAKVATSEAVDAGDLLVAGANGKLEVVDIENMTDPVTIVAKALESASGSAFINALVNPQLLK